MSGIGLGIFLKVLGIIFCFLMFFAGLKAFQEISKTHLNGELVNKIIGAKCTVENSFSDKDARSLTAFIAFASIVGLGIIVAYMFYDMGENYVTEETIYESQNRNSF